MQHRILYRSISLVATLENARNKEGTLRPRPNFELELAYKL